MKYDNPFAYAADSNIAELDQFSIPLCNYKECVQTCCWSWEGQEFCMYHVHLATNFEFYKKLVDWHSKKKK